MHYSNQNFVHRENDDDDVEVTIDTFTGLEQLPTWTRLIESHHPMLALSK